MKILSFTDLHRNEKYLKALLGKIKKYSPDVLICAGDLSSFSHGLKSLLKKFNELNLPFLIIPGNHETPEEIEVYSKELKNIHSIHLRSFIKDNVFFIGCGGGGFTSHHAEFEQSEEKFARDIKKLKLQDHRYHVVLVTHQPPYKTKVDYIYGEYAGSKSIRNFIARNQPDYCITGHLHENFKKKDKIGKTTIINPGPDGEIIEI